MEFKKIDMSHSTKNTLGIIYILWICIAWSIVGLYKFFFYSEILNLDVSISTMAKKLTRFFVFIGPILIFILCNIKKPWYRWLGLYGYKRGALFKTIVLAFLYIMISSLINIYGFHKKAHLSSISPIFWFTAFSLSIIMEEIAFRGFLFYLFEGWNKNIIVLVTSLAFAAKHLPGWFFFPRELSPLGFIGDFCMVFFVGCILGYLYLVTHSIWATSLIHSTNNLIVELFK